MIAVDPFSKWVEAELLPTKQSWRTARALYTIVARWGKPHWVTTDNGQEFAGSFQELAGHMGVKLKRITVGNSRANGQVERTIRTVKDVIRRMLTAQPDSFWSDHLAPALMALRFTPHRVLKLPPFTVVSGRTPVPPSYLLGDAAHDVPAEEPWEQGYLDWVVPRILALQAEVTPRL